MGLVATSLRKLSAYGKRPIQLFLPRSILNQHFLSRMARGHQKIQSQAKAQKKAADLKKAQGCDQKGAALKALVHKCTVCMAQMPDPKTYRQHFENRHPKAPMPVEIADVQA